MSRPIPMVDDIALDSVIQAEHRTRQRIASVAVAGLQGDVQQALGRASHDITITGVMVGEGSLDALSKLQKKSASGAEVVFHGDISSALEIDKVVIREAMFREQAGRPGRYEYRLLLRESPPLPPPAELSPFGGLDGVDLGFGDLEGVLGDIADAAGEIQSAVEQVTEVMGQLESLASLSDLALGNPLEPLQGEGEKLAAVGEAAAAAGGALGKLLGGGS